MKFNTFTKKKNMKKNLLLLLFAVSFTLTGQNKIAKKVADFQQKKADFKEFSIFNSSKETPSLEMENTVSKATYLELDQSKCLTLFQGKYDFIKLAIPYQNQTLSVFLYKVNPLAEGFHVDTNKSNNIAVEMGVYYRGCIENQPTSVASFNIFRGELNGIVSNNSDGNIVIGKMNTPNNQNQYIIYSDANLKIKNGFSCHTQDSVATFAPRNRRSNQIQTTTRCVTFYYEVDYNIYEQNNQNLTQTVNWMTSVNNNVQTLYDNDDINVALKSIFVWTDPDPYDGIGTSSFEYLNAFNEFRPFFDGDVGQLVGIDDGGLGGVAATIDGLCSQSNYSYSDVNSLFFATVPTYSWVVQVLTHEFGHLLGSRHTHACAWNGNNTSIDGCGQQEGFNEGNCADGPIPLPDVKGTIMSYCHLVSGVGISLANGFGPQPAQAMQDNVESKTCLSFDCQSVCLNGIFNVRNTETTSTTATFTWEDESTATSWEVSAAPFNQTPTNWQIVSTTTATITNLTADTYYEFFVRPLCSVADVIGSSETKIFITAGSYCAGVTFTDTGGLNADYGNLQNYTRTVIPTVANRRIRVVFTSFNLEQDYDFLSVYNGLDEFGADLSSGGFTGDTTPQPITSTHSSGGLTFKFTSDGFVTESGWAANISCVNAPLGVEDNNFIDFIYYPNPTKDKVNMTSNTLITHVSVYNIEGRLLLEERRNDLETAVDISQFSAGTYFFKVKFDNREMNFKIIKL